MGAGAAKPYSDHWQQVVDYCFLTGLFFFFFFGAIALVSYCPPLELKIQLAVFLVCKCIFLHGTFS